MAGNGGKGGGSRKISAITVPIRSDVSGFSKGIAEAKKAASDFGKKVGGIFAGSGLRDSIEKARKSLEDFGKTNVGQVAKGLSSVSTAAAGVAVAAIGAGAAFATIGSRRITELGNVSLQLGIASDKLSELQFAAKATGASSEDLNGFLKGLTETVHASIGQITPASEAFRKLGTSAEELSGLSLDQQFARLKAGFDALPSAAEKASAAVAIGGESGLKLFKLLGKSAAEFEALKAKSKSSGFTVSPEDLAKVQALNESWNLIGATFDGLVNKLTAAVAPAVEYVSTAFGDWFASVTADSKFFDRMIDGFIGQIGRLADTAVSLSLTFRDVFSEIAKAIGSAIGWIAKLLDKVAHVVPAMQGVADGVKKVSETVAGFGEAQAKSAAAARASFDKSKPSEALNKAYSDFKENVSKTAAATARNTAATREAATANKGLLEGVLQLNQSFRDTIADAGLSAEQKQIAALQRQGASPDAVASLQRQAPAVREAGKRDSIAEELRESTKTPFQKLGEDLNRIDQLVREGKITQQQALLGAAQKTRDSGIAGSQVQFAGALQSNSQEGRSYLLSQTIGKPESAIETARKGVEATMQGNSILGRIADSLSGALKSGPVVGF